MHATSTMTAAQPVRKILIVYENAGGGHRKAARILENILKRDDTEIVKTTVTEDLLGQKSNPIVALWNFLVGHGFIWLADVLVNYALRIALLPIFEVAHCGRLFARLDELEPDVVISTADGVNKSLGCYCQRRGIPFFVLLTDFSVCVDMLSPHAEHLVYVRETGDALRSFRSDTPRLEQPLEPDSPLLARLRYVLRLLWAHTFCSKSHPHYRDVSELRPQQNSLRCRTIGLLRDPEFHLPLQAGLMRASLGLNDDVATVVVANGSFGGAFVEAVVGQLRRFPGKLNIVAVCGHDEQCFKRLSQARDSSTIRVMPLPFIENVHEVLAACDAVIARPTAGFFAEAMLMRTPFVAPGFAAANDRGTLQLIEHYQLGVSYKTDNEIPSALESVLARAAEVRGRIEEFVQANSDDYPSQAGRIREIVLRGAALAAAGK